MVLLECRLQDPLDSERGSQAEAATESATENQSELDKLTPSLGQRIVTKVGHGGTLDPMAEGVLVLGVGEGTKLLEGYLSGSKAYTAEALLGAETDTLDRTGA